MTKIKFVLGLGLLLSLPLVSSADINVGTDCQGKNFANNHWVVSSIDGPLVLSDVQEYLKNTEDFKVVEKFDHVTSADGERFQTDGIVISFLPRKNKSLKHVQEVLDTLETFPGVNLGCVSRKSFDEKMNLVNF